MKTAVNLPRAFFAFSTIFTKSYKKTVQNDEGESPSDDSPYDPREAV